jgi:hypothetical protein
MLFKENPFRLNYISGGDSFVTSKVRKESTKKMRWTKGDQETTMELVLWKQIYIVTNTPSS